MSDIYVYLELSHEDVEVLRRALEIRLNDLRFELARTEDHDYKIDLRHQLDRLEYIDRELQGPESETKFA